MQHLAPEDFLWERIFDVYPPFSAVLTIHFPNDGVLKILNACCPISHNKTRLFVPLTRNFDTTGDLQAVYDFNAQIFADIAGVVCMQAIIGAFSRIFRYHRIISIGKSLMMHPSKMCHINKAFQLTTT